MASTMTSWLPAFWPLVLAAASLGGSLAASVHIVLHRHEPRGSLGWLGLVWLVPLGGALLYVMFGINRIARRARLLRAHVARGTPPAARVAGDAALPAGGQWRDLRTLMDRVNDTRLVSGNRIEVLKNGDECYPAMLGAIDKARGSVALSSFILGNDEWGGRFIDALAGAARRGVEVRVLIDGAGQYYTFPPIGLRLRGRGIPYRLFIHSLLPWRMPYLNLRNHRKLLVVDGCHGFTGGMNLSAKHAGSPPSARDLHFRVSGPVVAETETDRRDQPLEVRPSDSDRGESEGDSGSQDDVPDNGCESVTFARGQIQTLKKSDFEKGGQVLGRGDSEKADEKSENEVGEGDRVGESGHRAPIPVLSRLRGGPDNLILLENGERGQFLGPNEPGAHHEEETDQALNQLFGLEIDAREVKNFLLDLRFNASLFGIFCSGQFAAFPRLVHRQGFSS